MIGELVVGSFALTVVAIFLYIIYIEVVVPDWYQKQKDTAERNRKRMDKVWATKNKKRRIHGW
jgi:hypothetical protein